MLPECPKENGVEKIMDVMKRKIGKSGIEVSAMGTGCWAIGGPAFEKDGTPIGWGDVNDEDSLRGLQTAMDMGITLFDTSNMYGTGHSESLIGQAIKGRRDKVVISTKFGWVFDPVTRTKLGWDVSPAYIRKSCEYSLKRLGTDYIDVYFLHVYFSDREKTVEVWQTLEELVQEGKIRTYGWSTDDVDSARVFAPGPHCGAVQHGQNIFEDNAAMLELCDEYDLASFNRGPLAMGLLTGKFRPETTLKDNDIRGKNAPEYMKFFKDGRPNPEFLSKVESIREILTEGGRTPAQGALGWLWARSPRTIPIPGFKTPKQVMDNAKALGYGPLSEQQMEEISRILDGMR